VERIQSRERRCTYCGGTDFWAGPSGGGSVNQRCANPKCRHWFTETAVGFEDLQAVEPLPEEVGLDYKRAAEEFSARNLTIYNEGVAAFKADVSLFNLLRAHQSPFGGYASGENLWRFAGWLDALHEVVNTKARREVVLR
jgi:hypothetical protein